MKKKIFFPAVLMAIAVAANVCSAGSPLWAPCSGGEKHAEIEGQAIALP